MVIVECKPVRLAVSASDGWEYELKVQPSVQQVRELEIDPRNGMPKWKVDLSWQVSWVRVARLS